VVAQGDFSCFFAGIFRIQRWRIRFSCLEAEKFTLRMRLIFEFANTVLFASKLSTSLEKGIIVAAHKDIDVGTVVVASQLSQ
jgi:hypothetical protein